MSTFSGKIQEIPYISVDRFDGDNFNSEAYFLSHCHTDHMVGLYHYHFKNNLLENNKYLYTSEISSVILKKMYPDLENNIKILDIYTPTTLLLKGGNISVLPIPAGHCPGSVMFLFETNIRILYTGDYRINKRDIKKIKSFTDSYNRIKEIEKIYLDTTFFLKSYLRFPKREESLEELCRIIKEWIEKGKNHLIHLSTGARYGYEYVFNEIHRKFGMPVHVLDRDFKFYSTIPEMDNSVTLDGAATQIHCNCGTTFGYTCYGPSNEERTIRVSAFMWKEDKLENGLSSSFCDTYHNVCYSTHASYEEGVELLTFLKPKSVEICVKHNNPDTNMEMLKLIEEILEDCKPNVESEIKHKLFETEDILEETSEVVEQETSLNGFHFGILDSPPRNTKQIRKKFSIEMEDKTISTVDEQLSKDNSLKTENNLTNQEVTVIDFDSFMCVKNSQK